MRTGGGGSGSGGGGGGGLWSPPPAPPLVMGGGGRGGGGRSGAPATVPARHAGSRSAQARSAARVQALARIGPPGGRAAELARDLALELGGVVTDVGPVLSELLALRGEPLLLLGAEVERGGADAAGRVAAAGVPGAGGGEGLEAPVDLLDALLRGTEIPLEGVAAERGAGGVGGEILVGPGRGARGLAVGGGCGRISDGRDGRRLGGLRLRLLDRDGGRHPLLGVG